MTRSVVETAEAVRAGAIRAEELVAQSIERIGRTDASLNAFVALAKSMPGSRRAKIRGRSRGFRSA